MQVNNSNPLNSNPSTSGAASPSGSNSASSLAQLSSNLNNFLTLLTTQLQYQDPLSPMDSTQFTNQLVQFASVEQQIQSNKNLESLISLQQTNNMVGAVSYIGKEVEVTGQTATLKNGKATFSYTLPSDANAAVVGIYDANGKPVSVSQAELTKGRHDFVWDGKDAQGNAVPEGQYTIQVTAVDSNNSQITPTYTTDGTVTSVGIEKGVATLDLNGVQVPLSNVVRVVNGGSSGA
jgi:flagellar basal-body rod modification protein FlgD